MVTLSEAFRQHIPALTFTDPYGDYFIWFCLPEGTDTETVLTEANKHQVGFQPGIKFSSAKGLRNYLRFCFAFYGEEDLVEGVARLSRIIS
jgi:DNA-binding transcriptional MocR family regulator